jgi:hypothetical protein
MRPTLQRSARHVEPTLRSTAHCADVLAGRHGGMRLRRGIIGLFVIAATAPLACSKRSGPDIAQLSAQARKLGDELDGQRRSVLAQIPPTVVPRPDLGPCPVAAFQKDPYEPTDTPAMSDTIMEDVFLVRSSGFADAKEVATKSGPRRRLLETELRLYEGKTSAEDVEHVRKTTQRAWFEPDLVLVIDELALPALLDDKTFQAGMLRGRAYVWDFEKAAIVCASMVYVESSPTVKLKLTTGEAVPKNGAEYLRGDLYEQGMKEAMSSLVVAGPRKP